MMLLADVVFDDDEGLRAAVGFTEVALALLVVALVAAAGVWLGQPRRPRVGTK